MHYQAAPHGEAKLVRCTRGAIFDVAVDLRPDSPTLLPVVRRRAARATAWRSCFIPAGSRTASRRSIDDTEVLYQMTYPVRGRGGAAACAGTTRRSGSSGRAPPGRARLSERDATYPDFVAVKRVLVTGSGGFIGRGTLAPLAARGYEVRAQPRPTCLAPGRARSA